MIRFQHHPDNFIFINDNSFPLDWFLTQEPDYSGIPDNAIGRLYIPGKRHHITIIKDDTPTQFPGAIDGNNLWAEGDKYIKKLQYYIDAYNLFINPPPVPPNLDEYKALTIAANQKEAGARIAALFNTTYGSDKLTDRRFNDIVRYNKLREKETSTIITPLELTELEKLREKAHLIDIIKDAENTAASLIEAATDKTAVDAITVIWSPPDRPSYFD